MTEYALLVLPSTNRVYGQAAPALAAAELAALSQLSLGGRVTDVGELMLAGVPYVRFRSSDPLSPAELTVVSNLSSLYALFEVDGDALRPVTITPLAHWDDDLITIQRYAGKTNEQFTHLLLNLAVAVADGWTEKLRVLDPVCGRGTTLNQAVRYGYDAVGIDVDGRDIDAFTTFFTTWLQDKRIRHETDRSRHRVRVRFAASKADLKAGRGQEVLAVAADTINGLDHVAKRSVDAIVADLPYGVQHGSRTGAGGRLRRSPAELLAGALPGWRAVLRPDGAIVLSFNIRTLAATEARDALATAGFSPIDFADRVSFEHRVDQAIVRDLVIARR